MKNNTLNNYNTIYIAEGSITSPTKVTIEVSSEDVKIGDEVDITGNITDDNNNPIILSALNLTADDVVIADSTFDTSGTFTGTYKASQDGNLTISVDADAV